MQHRMKDSGIEWIKQIPNHWNITRGKNILQLMKRLPEQNDEVVTCFRDGEVTLRKNRREEGFTFSDKEIGYQGIKKGDIVIHGMDGFAGAIGISDSDGKGSPVLVVCTTKENARYIVYYLRVLADQGVFVALATGIRERSCDLRWNKIADLLFPIPEINEQYRIANYLDRKCAQIDAIIAKQQQIIEKLKEYKLSVITEAVTKGLDPNVPMKDSGVEWIGMVPEEWRISRIKYICEFNPGTKKANHDVVSYAPMECVKDGYLIKKEIRHDGISTGLTSFEEGDIIMAKVTPCFENGNIAIAKDLVNKFGVGSSELFVFRAKKVNTQWLFYFLRNSIFKKLAEATMTGTGGLKRVSPSFIRDFSLALPPEKEQRRIIEYLDKKCMEIDRVIKYKQSAVEKLGQYKKSLIYEVVTGKMEV